MGHKPSTEGNLAITVKLLNYVHFDTAVPFPGNYPMTISYGYIHTQNNHTRTFVAVLLVFVIRLKSA